MSYKQLFVAAVVAAMGLSANADGGLSLKDCALYSHPDAPAEMVSEPSGTSYLSLSSDGLRVERHDYKTGKILATVMDTEKLRDCAVKSWDGFIVSPNERLMLLYTDVQPIYRHSFKASYYLYDIGRNNIKPLSANGAQEVPVFSPDSRMVAFVRDNNIFVAKIDYGTEVAVTKDGKANAIINGTPDWVYQEEFGMLSSLTWSPDNSMLAFIRWDESKVPAYTLPLYNDGAAYPSAFEYKYPVAGATNSSVKVVSYDVETRALKSMKIPMDAETYVNKIEFGKAANRLMVNTLNRDQNEMRLYAVNPRSAIAKLIYTDKSETWVDPYLTEMTRYYDNFFVVASERSGHRHLYQYSNAGALMRQITKGDWEVTAYYGYDPVTRSFYFQSTQDGPLERTVSVAAPNGVVKKLAVGGTNSATFNSTMTYYLLNHSDSKTPNTYKLYTSKGKLVRTVLDNSSYAARFPKSDLPVKEFITVDNGKGTSLNAYLLKPSNFSASKKYPVIVYQYSGPGSQLVLNKWDLDWLHYAAQNGYIVACVDGRGTGGRGKTFESAVYKNLGNLESQDQVAFAGYLSKLPYVDAARIGIFGWSYGGYETLMAMTQPGNTFAAGVAVAPVSDWRYYDSIYAERFMLTPQQNASGYDKSSAVKRAGNLKGRLLIISGTADDNVHIANTFAFVSNASQQNKIVDMMVYPDKDHHINGGETRFVLYRRILDYFNRNM